MLNGTDSDSDEEMFPSKFDKLLTFSLFFSTCSSKLVNSTFIITRYPKIHACARSAKTLHCWEVWLIN